MTNQIRIIIDLDEQPLRKIEALAEKHHRSRKAEIEFLIEQFVEEKLVSSKGVKA